ncbi:MAG: rhomboid family intramembrane serine protease [Deltaproteobacteria bacterium]|nr:rhomboid family intramembrane serine protease [Deltaproteobacteria bacterium]
MQIRAESAEHFNFRTHFAFSRVPLLSLGWVLVATLLTVWSRSDPVFALADRFVDFGAKSTAAMTESGEWWRLVSANFLHIGWLHLVFNACIILGFGGVLENVYRRSDAALVLITVGLGTTFASTLTASEGLSLGGSGVAIGCLSCATTFALRHFFLLRPRHRRLLLLVAGPLAFSYVALGYRSAGVDNAGHVGGALVGVVCGLWLEARLLSRERLPSIGWIVVLIAGVFIAFASLTRFESCGWRTLRPTDRISVDVPETMPLISKGPTYQVFDNGNGTSLLLEVFAPGPVDAAVQDYKDTVFLRFAESEDVQHLQQGALERLHLGSVDGVVLPLSFEGPRGAMVSWHVWVSADDALLHAVWTGRRVRLAQNEVLFRSWLSRLSSSH